jgi:trehalose-phosphatase
MAPVTDAWYAANHGLTTCIDGKAETPADVIPYVELARRAMGEIGDVGAGVTVEDKGAILALHYRLAESEEDAVQAIEAAIERSPAAREFRVHHARKVIELRPPLPINKGTAARDFLGRMEPGAVICLGDDATDIDMFRAVRSTGVPSALVAVANSEERGVLDEADYWVAGVDGVEALLEAVVTAIQ